MYISIEDIDKMKQEIATVQQERETHYPYRPELKRKVMTYAIQTLREDGPLYELSGKLGLETSRLVSWFREVLQKEELKQSE